jgi:short-subunit dehydrogenase
MTGTHNISGQEKIDYIELIRAASTVMETNFAGPSRYLLAAARVLKGKPDAAIIGISSVAGDRGRGSNFVYGSSKAGFSAFLSGLRNSLVCDGVHVLTVKPGFVDTQMTAGMNLPPVLTAHPEEVAKAILKAHRRGANEIYVRSIWRLIMLVIRNIPEPVFKKLKL